MLILALLMIPALAGAVAFGLKSDAPRRLLLVSVGLVHAGLTLATWFRSTGSYFGGWIQLDPLGQLFLTVTSILFVASAFSLRSLLQSQVTFPSLDSEMGVSGNTSEAVLTGGLLLLLSSMSCVTVVQHFGLLWMMLNVTLLSSLPLIYYGRSPTSMNLIRMRVLICFVGISVALMGNYLLSRAAASADGSTALVVSALIQHAGNLDAVWLNLAFLFFLIGNGVAFGMAPVHSWVLDAQREAMPVLGVLLGGAVANCAFLVLLRVLQVCHAAGLQDQTSPLLIGFGLLSLLFAWGLILRASAIPRLLAALGIGSLGIQLLGLGLGGVAISGTLLHVVGSSVTRGMLCLIGGNLMLAYRTRGITEVSSLCHKLPWSGTLWILGCLALCGVPPFVPFFSQLVILKGAFDRGRFVAGAIYLMLVIVIMVRVSNLVMRMSQRDSSTDSNFEVASRDGMTIGPPLALGILVLIMGFHIPTRLTEVFREAALMLGGSGW